MELFLLGNAASNYSQSSRGAPLRVLLCVVLASVAPCGFADSGGTLDSGTVAVSGTDGRIAALEDLQVEYEALGGALSKLQEQVDSLSTKLGQANKLIEKNRQESVDSATKQQNDLKALQDSANALGRRVVLLEGASHFVLSGEQCPEGWTHFAYLLVGVEPPPAADRAIAAGMARAQNGIFIGPWPGVHPVICIRPQ